MVLSFPKNLFFPKLIYYISRNLNFHKIYSHKIYIKKTLNETSKQI